MTLQDDGTKAIEGQKPIGLQPKPPKSGDLGGEQCPECGRETLAVKLYSDGSGNVHCKRENCGFKDKFYPNGDGDRP